MKFIFHRRFNYFDAFATMLILGCVAPWYWCVALFVLAAIISTEGEWYIGELL